MRLRELTPFHIEFVEGFIKRSKTPSKILDQNLDVFTKLFELKKAFEQSGPLNDDTQKAFDVAMNNLEEDIHSAMESAAIPLLELLRQRDASVVENDELYVMLTWFLGLQFARTTKIAAAFETFPDADLAPLTGVMRHIIALNMSHSLFASRRISRVSLLCAQDTPGVVTTDFPVVNVQGLMAEPNPDKLVLYYPVSPTRALRIDVGHPQPGVVYEDLPQDDVLRYNQLMYAKAADQVFAANEEELFRLQQTRK